ncbi:MAG TPA: diguanylate cyclase, partial [Fimbriimonas sp.]
MVADVANDRQESGVPARFHLWSGLGLLSVVVLYYVVNKSALANHADWKWFNSIGHALVPLIGLHLCFSGPRTTRKELAAIVPQLLASVSITYSLSTVLQVIERIYLPDTVLPPFPSDILNTMAPLLIASALLLWPTRPVPRIALPKILSDSLIFFFGLAAIVWVFALGPLYQKSTMPPSGFVMTAVYPFADLLMIVLLVMAIWRGVQPAMRPATWMVSAVVLALALGDGLFTMRKFGGPHPTTTPAVVMWPFACVICNLAGGWIRYSLARWPEQMDPERSEWSRPNVTRWLQAAPTLFLPFCVGLVAYALNSQPSHYILNGLYVFLFMFMVAIVAHQLFAVYENNQLYDGQQYAYIELGRSRAKLAEQYEELEEANSRLARLALVDGLTGLWNHRAFYEELERAQRDLPSPAAVLLIDVDFFKQYNDEFGHPAGDKALRVVGKVVRDSLPEDAFAAKFGGDEFAVLLRGESAKGAATVADQVRAAVAGSPVDNRAVTVSIGYAEWRISMSIDELIESADRSLYAAKSIGKNMVYGGPIRDLPTMALVEAASLNEADLDDPMAVGRVIVDAMRCDPRAVTLEPTAPIVGGLLATLEMTDPDTRRHSERVMWFTLSYAAKLRELGWSFSREDFRALAYGALLHDIGKIKIPVSILRSSKPLDRASRELMNAHPILGADLVAPFSDLEVSLDVIRSHHEQWDGKGYPLGLTGEEVPLNARIFGIVDAMDAMGSNRAYKHAMDWSSIANEIRYQTGRHFDPDL